MTDPKAKAKELVEKFTSEIESTDFHVPEFITGIPMANGSKEYEKILNKETKVLAMVCAIITCDEILDGIDWHEFETSNDIIGFWLDVKSEIEKL